MERQKGSLTFDPAVSTYPVPPSALQASKRTRSAVRILQENTKPQPSHTESTNFTSRDPGVRSDEHRTEYSPQTQYPSLPCRNPNTTFKPLCAFGGQPRLACRTSRAELNIRSDFDRVVSAFSGIPDIHWQLSGDHRTCTTPPASLNTVTSLEFPFARGSKPHGSSLSRSARLDSNPQPIVLPKTGPHPDRACRAVVSRAAFLIRLIHDFPHPTPVRPELGRRGRGGGGCARQGRASLGRRSPWGGACRVQGFILARRRL
ncbi:hypothetical protein C8Q78DRAFT_237719 [Trametes maxima]|nr:hypothetical protein C8Q78DRAFT_237719 [Trametes maxima]